MAMQIARVPLRKINDTLRLSLPIQWVRELGLTPYDAVDLLRDNGDVKLKFVKVEPPTELAESA
jgi:hypothetical protein